MGMERQRQERYKKRKDGGKRKSQRSIHPHQKKNRWNEKPRECTRAEGGGNRGSRE